MLTPQALDALLDRLAQLTGRGVGEALEAIQNDRLAIAPWVDVSSAVRTATLHAVAFANHAGGDLVLGIDETGRVTGCPGLDLVHLAQEIFARTRPGIVTDCWHHQTPDGTLVVVSVPADTGVYAMADGLRVRRVGRANLPITPDQDAHVATVRAGDDFSDRPFPGAQLSDLDPLQTTYLREILRRKNDQSELLELEDDELLRTLGLVTEQGVLRVAALLLLGSRRFLREHLPQTEVVYIHQDENDEPDVQEQLHLPLLHALSRLQDLIEARNRFVTMKQGLFHFKVKDFDDDVYREALVNALVHRDFSRRDGAVHVVHTPDRLEIANPGGFIGGVSVDNILYHPPRHRNRRLTEVLQQLGLMERAGAGVNRLYRYLLRKGKPVPEYQVTPHSVRLTIHAGDIDAAFARFVSEEEARGRLFSLDMLIILSTLTRTKAIDRATAAREAQRPERSIANTLNKLIAWGYLERVGAGRNTAYRLTRQVYDRLGARISYYRDRGLSERRQQALVLEVAEELGGLSNQECQELCGLGEQDASRLLRALVSRGRLRYEKGKYRIP